MKTVVLKPWEERSPGPTGICPCVRRVASWAFTVLLAATIGTLVFAAFAPIGGGPFIIISPIANLLSGLLLLAALRYRSFSTVTCRLAFYAFTFPTWIFLVWAVAHFISP